MSTQPTGERYEPSAAPKAHLELKLRREVQAPGVARAAVNGRAEDLMLSPSLCQTLVLLVSELVSNAVLYSQAGPETPILLTASVHEDGVFVTVSDGGEGFTPEPRKPGGRGGYGLYLVNKSARRWGVDRHGGTRVWFELARTP